MTLTYDVGFFRAWSNPDIPVRCGQIGALDIIVMIPKGVLWFDTKTGKARLSPEQKNFVAQLKEVHGEDRGFKITSIQQGIDIIQGFIDG